MQSNILTLGQILSAPSQYIIPVFQRNYRWDRPQWQKLWDSVVGLKQDAKIGNHFMGFLVLVSGLAMPGKNTRFHIVDGQQRITTTSIFMVALRNIARKLDASMLAEEIDDRCLVHKYQKGLDSFKLLPKSKDQRNYVAIVTGKVDGQGRIADALEFFEEMVEDHVNGSADDLRALYDLVYQRLSFMSATLEAENAYSIFKSLNSTGVALGQADLIRNFVFMHVRPEEQDAFDADYWSKLEKKFTLADERLDDLTFSKFFRDVLMIEKGYIQPPATFEKFEDTYEATNFAPAKLVDELLLHAKHLGIINNRLADDSLEVAQALAHLRQLESATTHPLLLALFAQRAAGTIGDSALAKCASMLAGFILRRYVCNESSRGYGQMFVRAINNSTTDPVTLLEAYLRERGWPDDARFRAALLKFPLYQRDYTKYMLESIERLRGHKEQADLAAAQIEHVMPQTLSDAWRTDLGADCESIHSEWLHTLGNLTLSGYNQELFNHPFARKRNEYYNSNIVITRELSMKDRWGKNEIEERGKHLVEEALKIWIGPSENAAVGQAVSATSAGAEEFAVYRERFWIGLADYLTDQEPNLERFDPKPKSVIRLQSGVKSVAFELRHLIRPSKVAIDVRFWRSSALNAWETVQARKEELDAAVDDVWEFGRPSDDSNPRWMTIELELPSAHESEWPAAYAWVGRKLPPLFDVIGPMLREEMGQKTAAGELATYSQMTSP